MPIDAVEYHFTGIPEEVANKVDLVLLTVAGDCHMVVSPATDPHHIHVQLVITPRKVMQ